MTLPWFLLKGTIFEYTVLSWKLFFFTLSLLISIGNLTLDNEVMKYRSSMKDAYIFLLHLQQQLLLSRLFLHFFFVFVYNFTMLCLGAVFFSFYFAWDLFLNSFLLILENYQLLSFQILIFVSFFLSPLFLGFLTKCLLELLLVNICLIHSFTFFLFVSLFCLLDNFFLTYLTVNWFTL